ncbi:formate dehydrogenase subunit delta [Nocardioides sp.]|uniref:formate dehydrogenase subunit delta n=1 Tax=Nocardioides sp. TaxID=35761 RepID=UPI003D11AD33
MGEPAVVRMANDIARQFAHLPEPDAAAAVAAHLEMFWEPRMRRELQAEVEREPDQLAHVVVTAVSLVETV